MAMWLVPENELTVEQRKAVQADTHKHRVINGLPGSGKESVK